MEFLFLLLSLLSWSCCFGAKMYEVEYPSQPINFKLLCGEDGSRSIAGDLDRALNDVRRSMYDPVPLPDAHFQGITLYDGEASGLPSVYRAGDAIAECVDDETAYVTISMGIEKPRVHYKLKRKVFVTTLKGSLGMKLDRLEVSGKVKVVQKEGSDKVRLSLEDMKVTRMEGLKMEVGGFGPFSRVLSDIGTGASNALKWRFVDSIQKPVANTLNYELSKVDKPREVFGNWF